MDKRLFLSVLIVSLPVLLFARGQDDAAGTQQSSRPSMTPAEAADYLEVIYAAENMVYDSAIQQMADEYGLDLLNVTWEDTGRYDNSAVGPNISDMTIQIQHWDPAEEDYSLHLMPVLRYPNFTDITGDVPIDRFYILVGNEKGEDLQKITLKEFLENPGKYMSDPSSWEGGPETLLAARDTHVLTSAQACFLPVPQKGIAEFNPVLFNYQSSEGNPAVLTILCTREGTSMTIIDNTRDGFDAGWSWGQRLFFNTNGERAVLTGQRLSDYLDEENPLLQTEDSSPIIQSDEGENTEGLNMVLLIQVPLKYDPGVWGGMYFDYAMDDGMPMAAESMERSDVEAAVIGHGAVEGPYTEIDGLDIERDPDFPIRVTVQFYKATSNGVVSEADMADMAAQINRVYEDADYVGSLVVDGRTERPTEYFGEHQQPPFWWDNFWLKHYETTGMTVEETMQLLFDLFGREYRVPNDEEDFAEDIGDVLEEE